jgi:hypothetical protein
VRSQKSSDEETKEVRMRRQMSQRGGRRGQSEEAEEVRMRWQKRSV